LIEASSEATKTKANGEHKASHRVIADHLRASSFLIAEGVLPSNEGRGYVLRRIMRRAMRHAQILGATEPLMWKLAPVLIAEMGAAYPELVQGQSLITETLKLEEERFGRTLVRGLALLDETTSKLKSGDVLSGETAFTLYDTYGFPLDLTQDALKRRNINVDIAGFEKSMSEQKTKARASWAGSGETATETMWFPLKDKLGATEFLGYDYTKAEGVVTALLKEGKEVQSLNANDEGYVLLNQTPFYAESGGQVGDTGTMRGQGVEIDVSDTQKKLGDLFAHKVKIKKGMLKVGSALELEVDAARRNAIRANHSATHILHEALRQVLGDHVAQKGSLVAPDRLRFDISHPKQVAPEEIEQVEKITNELVRGNTAIVTRLMPVDAAIASGARALFGEKYGDEVRVVSMGPEVAARFWSSELCGGTHAARTGDIGLVTITSESGVSAGVRRIEALTGEMARTWLNSYAHQLRDIAMIVKTTPVDAAKKVEVIIEERRALERQLGEAKKKSALSGSAGEDTKTIAGISYLSRVIEGVAANDLKSLVDEGKKQVGSGIVAFVGVNDDKAAIVVGVTKDLTSRFNAVDLVRAGAEVLGGKGGGGRPDMAQAGGPNFQQADAALTAIEKALSAA
jgi:alanyl-tRNA synthetase